VIRTMQTRLSSSREFKALAALPATLPLVFADFAVARLAARVARGAQAASQTQKGGAL
jgi:hypothetical protein